MASRLPQLESLRVFEASARHCNFSRAALELGVTSTAVSLRIRNLEREVGRPLFKRRGPRIELTEAGANLAQQMSEILTLIRSAVAACRDEATPLRVTVTPTFAYRWLASRLPDYLAREGAADIEFDISIEVRASGDFDVAVRSGYGDRAARSEELLPILRTPMLSPDLASRARISTIEDLTKLPLLRDKDWTAWFTEAGVSDVQLTFASFDYVTQDMEGAAAARGVGVALLSPILFRDMLASGALVQPFDHVMRKGDGYHVFRNPHAPQAAVSHFVEWLREEAAASIASATH